VDLAGATRTVDARNALGSVTVLVPDGVAVAADGQVDLGSVSLFGSGGDFGLDRHAATSLSPPGAHGQLVLHLRAGVGAITVTHGSSSVPSASSAPPAEGHP